MAESKSTTREAEAAFTHSGTSPTPTADNAGIKHPRFYLWSYEELAKQAPPEWQVKPLFEQSSFVLLYGPSNHGKSFLALDWALRIASGTPMLGHEVKQGPVVYVCAEGSRALRRRIEAWKLHNNGADISDANFIIHPVQLRSTDDIKKLRHSLDTRKVKPKLIVIDTLARCFDGDENLAKDVSQAVEVVSALQRDYDTTVMVGCITRPRTASLSEVAAPCEGPLTRSSR